MDDLDFDFSSTPTRRRSSLYVIETERNTTPATLAQINYEKQIERELEDWQKLLASKRNKLIQMHTERKTLDTSLLSKERLDYIYQAPDIEKIVQEAENYVRKVKFLEIKAADISQKAEDTVKRLQSIFEEKAVNLMNQLIFD